MNKKMQTRAGDIGHYANGVYTLPAKVGHAQAPALLQALGLAANALVVDASALREFDSSLLVVLMQIYRTAGDMVKIQHAPAQLLELIRAYGVEEAMPAIGVRADEIEKFASAASSAE